MSPYRAPDISALARTLRERSAEESELPGHVRFLNPLAQAAGFRNFQHYKAAFQNEAEVSVVVAPEPAPEPVPEPVPEPPLPPAVDPARTERLLRFFDAEGRLTRRPSKPGERTACLWVVWSRLSAGSVEDEEAFNRRLNALHTYGDHATPRRELRDQDLVRRTPDGREYRRVEAPPPPDAPAVIRRLPHTDGRA